MKNYYEYIERYMKNRPHVVILGAGESCAAIPNGDKYGKRFLQWVVLLKNRGYRV